MAAAVARRTRVEGRVGAQPRHLAEPDALSELVRAAEERGKGLVGSRVMFPGRTDIGSSRGLRWRKLGASTEGVDIFAPVDPPPDPADVEARINLHRACRSTQLAPASNLGLMDERYFLYFEDFDWGVRAKASCGIGYAHDSIIPHVGGSSTGAVHLGPNARGLRSI